MNISLFNQTFKANFAVWGLTTVILNVLLGQMVAMPATRPLLGSMFFQMLVPAISAIFIIITGNKLIANQVDCGSMVYILTTPIKRSTVALTQSIYFAFSLFLTFASMTATALITNNLSNAGLKNATLLHLNVASFTLAIAFAGIMFLASCIFNLSKYAYATGGLLILAFILIAIIGSFSAYGVSSLDWVNNFTLVSLVDIKNILTNGSAWIGKAWILAGISMVTLLLGNITFCHKDLPL